MVLPNNPSDYPWILILTDTATILATIQKRQNTDVQAYVTGAESNFGWIIRKTEVI